MQFIVETPGAPGPPQPESADRPKTPVRRSTEATFAAPVGDPGGRRFAGTWHAVSLGVGGEPDGLWDYERSEGEVLHWTVTYVPTGQRRVYTSLDKAGGAREATAGGLLDELRGEAFTAAFDGGTDDRLAAGQRWLAVHMRLAGHTEVDTVCGCGGLVVRATGDGRYVHVDACERCLAGPGGDLGAGCPDAAGHRFCARPDPQLTERDLRMLAFERRWWNQPGAKLVAIRQEFPGLSDIRYYAELNRLAGMPAALKAEPAVVRRLLRQRARRGGGTAQR